MPDDRYRDFYAALERVHDEIRQRARRLRTTGTWSDVDMATGYEGAASMLHRVLVDFAPGRIGGP